MPCGENMKKILLVSCLAVVASNVFASVTLLTSRAQITETDYIDWSDLGATFTPVADPTVVVTHGTPFNIGVDAGSATLERRDGDNGWLTGYATNDPLLYVQQPAELYLTGAKTCLSVGAVVDGDHFGNFTAYMEAWDGVGTYLGSVSVNGHSGDAGPTAPFIGIHSDAGDIHKVGIYVVNEEFGQDSFALNRVSYNCCGPVPEPASMSVLALGALGLLRKKRAR